VTRYSDGYLAGFKDAESRLKGFEMGRRPATEYHAVIGEVLKRLEKTTLAQPTPRSQS
jgi:hypothetical protein